MRAASAMADAAGRALGQEPPLLFDLRESARGESERDGDGRRRNEGGASTALCGNSPAALGRPFRPDLAVALARISKRALDPRATGAPLGEWAHSAAISLFFSLSVRGGPSPSSGPAPARLGSSSSPLPSLRLCPLSSALTLVARHELPPEAAAAGPEPVREGRGLAVAGGNEAWLGGVFPRRAEMPPRAGGGGVGGPVVDGGGGGRRAGGGRAVEPVGVRLVPAGGDAAAQRHGAGGAGAGVHGARADAPARGGAGHARARHHPPLR